MPCSVRRPAGLQGAHLRGGGVPGSGAGVAGVAAFLEPLSRPHSPTTHSSALSAASARPGAKRL